MSRRKPVTKTIWNAAKVMLFLYALIGILLWTFQDKLLFQSKQLPPDYRFDFKQPHRDLLIRLNEQEQLSIVEFYPEDTLHSRGVVLYFHGNRENINHYAKFVPSFTRNGYEVWMMDYPGYGKSTGEPTEQRFYSDALLLYKMAEKQFSSDSIIFYGKSLGTGVATELASHAGGKRLILETPYYSLPSLASAFLPIYPTSSMLQYKFSVHEYLTYVQMPVTIFHGTEDGVIPYKNAEMLKPFLKSGDEFITIEKGEHNDLSTFNLYQQKLDSVLKL
ncbi:MAG TPA: alpha/beta hydrolase [Lacibacter sp.]|nr:alpha/beta hydrolase [Lacibacter sp.]